MPHHSRSLFAFLLALTLVSPSACDLFPLFPDTPGPNVPGSSFATAGLITYEADDTVTLTGTVQGSEVDVYDLGPFSAGDRVIVTVNATVGSALDPTIALFDGDEDVFAVNDDVDFDAGNFNSSVDDFIVEPTDHLYLAITRFFQSSQGGDYEALVEVVRDGTVPTPPVQTLLLNFAGGPLTITGDGSYNLDPFDAADIDDAYDGRTDDIKDIIVDTVRENFAGTGVIVVSSDENPMLVDGTFSTVHFGAFSGDKFGIADNVDQGNRDRCDDAIVFTDQFDDPFANQPTVSGVGVAIGNVAAHEAGHLLGLNHVADITALMDNTGSASTLLADQDFKTAPLSPSIFPFGNQNDSKILNRVVPEP